MTKVGMAEGSKGRSCKGDKDPGILVIKRTKIWIMCWRRYDDDDEKDLLMIRFHTRLLISRLNLFWYLFPIYFTSTSFSNIPTEVWFNQKKDESLKRSNGKNSKQTTGTKISAIFRWNPTMGIVTLEGCRLRQWSDYRRLLEHFLLSQLKLETVFFCNKGLRSLCPQCTVCKYSMQIYIYGIIYIHMPYALTSHEVGFSALNATKRVKTLWESSPVTV